MKLLGLMMIFVGCAFVGFLMDAKNKKRLKELEALVQSFEQLKGDIDYRLTPLPEACIHIAGSSGQGVGHIFRNFGMSLDERKCTDTGGLWREAIEKEKHRYSLQQEDYEVLYGFGRQSGYMDKEMQKKQIEFVLIRLRELVAYAQANKEKSSKLYTGMGILIGACLCILLI